MNGGDKSMRVVIWGGGNVGKHVLYNLQRERWKNFITVIGITDSRYETVKSVVPVYSPNRVVQMWHEQKIDGVVLGVSLQYRAEVYEQIKKLMLPVLHLLPDDKKRYVDVSDIAKNYYVLDGVNIYEVDDCYVSVDHYNGIAWQYTADGILRQSFNYKGLIGELEPFAPLFLAEDIKGNKIVEEIDGEVCVLYRHWTTNYAHFTFEALDRLLLLEKNGYQGKYLIYHSNFIEELIRMTGISMDRVIWARSEDDWKLYKLKNNICVELFHMAQTKTLGLLYDWAQNIRIKLCADADGISYPSKIFIKRIGTRKLIGMDKILGEYGFSTLIPEDLSVEEQIKYFAHADIVVSPHGANSANVVYMRPKSTLVETFGKRLIHPCFLPVVRYAQVSYHMLVESVLDESQTTGQHISDDYTIDPVLFETVISQL